MRSSFFWVIMQRGVIISYRRFGTTYLYRLQGSKIHLFIMFEIYDRRRFCFSAGNRIKSLVDGFPGKFLKCAPGNYYYLTVLLSFGDKNFRDADQQRLFIAISKHSARRICEKPVGFVLRKWVNFGCCQHLSVFSRLRLICDGTR
jgi:hypothetical protein